MDDLTVIFEEQRTHLCAVPDRLLGSVREADDLVTDPAAEAKHADVPFAD